MDHIENRTYAELKIGETASLSKQVTPNDISLFAKLSGDARYALVDGEFAKSDTSDKVVAHDMWGGAMISTVIEMELPGPGTIYLAQTLHFRQAVELGDTVTVTVKVAEKDDVTHRVKLDCIIVNQKGLAVVDGSAEVVAPVEKILRPRIALSSVESYQRGQHYRRLLTQSVGLVPLKTAVIHPVDAASLLGAIKAAQANLIVPTLIGPEAKIRAAAQAAELDLSSYVIIPTEHSHAAAAKAVELAKNGIVEALMKGSLHTDELMRAIICEPALHTERRMSHVFVIDAPGYPRPLFLSDAAINIYPTLDQKRDIIQNAIDLTHALGLSLPKVAILSAVESVTDKIKSTIDAAALCKMADRRQITGGVLDGPLAFDNAVSLESAKTKGIVSPVAGQADVFVVPDIESGNMLAKQLAYIAGADIAGIVLGARVPVILTSRSDNTLSRLSSCAIALLLTRNKLPAGT